MWSLIQSVVLAAVIMLVHTYYGYTARGGPAGVGEAVGAKEPVVLKLQIDSDKIEYIPANVEAQIRATTVFGAKFVDLVYPDNPSPRGWRPVRC